MNINIKTLYVGLLTIDTTTYAFTSPFGWLIGQACVRKANELLGTQFEDMGELSDYKYSDECPTYVEFNLFESDYLDMT